MPSIRYLHIRFDQNIFPYEIHRFRAAVIEKTRRIAPWFHNHQDDGKSIYRYPLIQYKVAFKKASILCLHEAFLKQVVIWHPSLFQQSVNRALPS